MYFDRWRTQGVTSASIEAHTLETRIRGVHVGTGVQRRIAGHGRERHDTQYTDHRRL